MSEGSQRYCGNCGAEIRAGTSFCVSCGASLVQDLDPPASSHDTVASGGNPKTEDGLRRDHSTSKDQDGGSPRSIYDEYALRRRFFQESRDGLVRFSERLKQGDSVDSEGLTHNDLAGPLLRAQMGLDKAEEYKETLTAPLLGSEFSLPEVRSVLTELREIQKDVLALLETFWDKLEAQEGHVQFKDEFARWYTESLELLASVEPTHRQPRAASVSSEPPLQGQGGPTESSEGATPSELLNRAINWFKDLPSVPKLIIVGLVLLLLLTVLSPVAQVAAIIVFVLSAIVLIALAVQRKPLRGWIIAVIGSVVLIPVFGGISGAIYGSGSIGGTSSDPGLGIDSEAPPIITQISPSNPSDLYSLGPVYQDTPYYEVNSLYPTSHSGGAAGIILLDSTVENCERDLKLVTDDLTAQTENFDWWTFSIKNYGPLLGEGVEFQEGLANFGNISVSNTEYGESVTGVQAGYYSITKLTWCD